MPEGAEPFLLEAERPGVKRANARVAAMTRWGDAGAMPAPPELSGLQRRFLRARANPLRALVQVGDAGVSPGVLQAIDAALEDHELVKVRLRQPEDKKRLAAELAKATSSALCGLVGHTVILYRPHPETPKIEVPSRQQD